MAQPPTSVVRRPDCWDRGPAFGVGFTRWREAGPAIPARMAGLGAWKSSRRTGRKRGRWREPVPAAAYQDAPWLEALGFEGFRYDSLVNRILDSLPTTGMRPDWDSVIAPRSVHRPVGCALPGGSPQAPARRIRRAAAVCAVIDPRNSRALCRNISEPGLAPRENILDPPDGPSVFILAEKSLGG